MGPNTGLTPSSAAKTLGMEKQNFNYYRNLLVKGGYIERIGGKSNPTLYRRGPKAAILDSGVAEGVKTEVKEKSMGSICTNDGFYSLNGPSKSAYVPLIRAHINGRYSVEVIREGDLASLSIPEGEGKATIRIFKPETYTTKGVQHWQGQVPLDGRKITIEYAEGQDSKLLFVWPQDEYMTAEPVRDGHARAVFDHRVTDVLAILSKYGGWVFGQLEMAGKLEYGCSEPTVIDAFQSATREPPADSQLRFDHSVTVGEGETDNGQTAYDVFSYEKATRELRADAKEIRNGISQLSELGQKTDLLIEITGKLEIAVERIAGIEAMLIERAARENVAKVETITKDQGVMFG